MLTRVKIQNFKSIGEPGVDLELKPLTILVGPNGGGKSSILEAIALIAQSVGGELRHSGELVKFSGLQDFAHKGDMSRVFQFEAAVGSEYTYSLDLQLDSGETEQTIAQTNNKERFVTLHLSGDRRTGLSLIAESSRPMLPPFHPLFPRRADFMPILDSGLYVNAFPTDTSPFPVLEQVVSNFANVLRGGERVFLLSALRGHIPFETDSGTQPKWVGVTGENLLPILAFIRAASRYQDVEKRITRWAQEYGLAGLQTGISGPYRITAEYMDPQLKMFLNLALASQGSRQVLPVLTQLFWSAPGSLVMIEEPEESLHPDAQVKLIELFADALKDGKQVLTTTHSTLLLLAMSEAVEKEAIKPNDIAIYEITKTSSGTKAKRIPVSDKGILKGWVPSFAKVESRLLRNALNRLPEA